MSNAIIEVEGLSKRYSIGETVTYSTIRDEIVQALTSPFRKKSEAETEENSIWVLRDISFKVAEGDIVGIIGRNGTGKSTLLKILSRITTPTEGRVVMKGRVASLLEVGTGFHPELTGRENILLNGALLGMGRAEIKSKFDEIVAFSEIEKFVDTPVKRYSSGMYVRLAFAVAAHLEPEILIVDEVLAVGDATFQKKCLGKMSDVAQGGRTVLFVSHNMGAVNRLCPKSILLDSGRVAMIDTTQNVINEYMAYGEKRCGTFEQANDKTKEMTLRKITLNPGSDEGFVDVPYDKPIVIRIEYEVNESITNCLVWFAIQTIEGNYVFLSTDCDLQLDLLTGRQEGYHISEVSVPEKWLNTGAYRLLAGIVRNNPSKVMDYVEVLNFTIIDTGNTPTSLLNKGNRRGVLQPFFDWTDTKVD